MSSEDTPRNIQGGTEANPKHNPPHQDQPNSDIKVGNRTKDNQKYPTDTYPERSAEQPEGRRGLTNIKNIIARPAEFWISLFTAVLAFFTAILAVETAISIRILSKTDDALHKTADAQQQSAEIADRIREITEDNERAWIGPNDARVDNKEIGKPIKATVTIMNSGRQPALANMHVSLKRYSTEEWLAEAYRTDVFTWQSSCFESKFSDKMATRQLFPGFIPGSYTYNLTYSSDKANPPFLMTEELAQSGDVVMVLGCFVYEPFKTTRRTIFCYYHDKDGDINHLKFCPIGQYAD